MKPVRVAVVGATGALGTEVLAALDGGELAVSGVLPFATDRSLGVSIEFQGEEQPVETEPERLAEAECVFVCTPPAAALEWIAAAVRLDRLVVDLSGALHVGAARLGVDPAAAGGRVLAPPPGPALAWTRVLAPLHEAVGLRRVVGTAMVSAAGAGRSGIDALQAETVALLGQRESPEPEDGGPPLAFDVLPWMGALGEDGTSESERILGAAVARALGGAPPSIAVTVVRVPTFCGDAATLALEPVAPLAPEQAVALLAGAVDVAVCADPREAATRAVAGTAHVQVSRVRRDPSLGDGLLLWLAADSTRLAAMDAVRSVAARLSAV